MTAEEEIEQAVLLAGPIYDTAAAVAAIEDIIRKRAAAELRNVAARIVDGALLSDLPGAARQALAIAARVVRDRAAALRASNGEDGDAWDPQIDPRSPRGAYL